MERRKKPAKIIGNRICKRLLHTKRSFSGKTKNTTVSYSECGFFQPSDVTALGLTNDQETMPKATLIIKNEHGELIICETEYTKKYL